MRIDEQTPANRNLQDFLVSSSTPWHGLRGAPVANYVSRIIYSMAREGNMPAMLKQVAMDGTPRPAILFTVLSVGIGLLFGLNDQAVATIIAFGTGGLYAMFTMTTGVGLYSRITGCWNPVLGQLKLGRWSLPIDVIAFHRSVFEFINIAWSMQCLPMPPGGNSGPCRWSSAAF